MGKAYSLFSTVPSKCILNLRHYLEFGVSLFIPYRLGKFQLGMLGKPTIGLLTFLCFSRGLQAQSTKAMSAGIHSVVYVTVGKEDEAKMLARGIVENRLAACVNIVPKITSVYRWKNEIQEDSELLLMIKTRTDTVDVLTEYVKSNHSYEVCEVISLPIQNGNKAYLDWISDEVPPFKGKTDVKEV
ncbi:uncharacterized protein LOC106636037 [Copidosoma floridanum]|uniref:uncharacterized protein LOC106636037 n=1 Tax=Copidosoma floridanum TaxID=29053 RepID=UPI0006C99791|nr:uncharacterized protein LOC106636037 [Copidosoma floridanum]